MNFFKKIKLEIDLFILKFLFNKVKENKKYEKFFKSDNGGNGIILFPKYKLLKGYCIKIPMNKNKKEKVLEKYSKGIIRESFEALIKNEGSIEEDYKAYIELIEFNELKKYIPKFYYVEKNKNSIDFIIMEKINGEKILLNDVDFSNLNKKEEQLNFLFNKLTELGFQFSDDIEGIYDEKRSHVILIDLGGIYKDNNIN